MELEVRRENLKEQLTALMRQVGPERAQLETAAIVVRGEEEALHVDDYFLWNIDVAFVIDRHGEGDCHIMWRDDAIL